MPAAISAKRKQKILDGLAEGLSIAGACRSVGVSPRTARTWREVGHTAYDKDFAEAADQAIEDGTDLLEDVAKSRAIDGSDVLTIFLLKGRRPSKYRDNAKIEHVGGDGPPIRTETEVKGVALSDVLDFARSVGAAPPGDQP